ncbi:Proline dehydrogenase 1, mitochondrial [Nymphon striatum]|nr:Proline dehydrogenase 1, mitochondrial [Nymphon striatum]
MAKVKLDEIDHQILDMLIDNTRTPFTDIAKKLLISCWYCTCTSEAIHHIIDTERVFQYRALRFSRGDTTSLPGMDQDVFYGHNLEFFLYFEKLLLKVKAKEWQRVIHRFDKVCQKAYDLDVSLLIDGEESWMQDAADDIVEDLMRKYNTEKAVVFNTLQMYRWDRLDYVKRLQEKAESEGFKIGMKVVRGAYLEKENTRAEEKGYPTPICASKLATDENFDAAIQYMIKNLDVISVFAGTHNEASSYDLMNLMDKAGIQPNDSRIWFGQLFGMSDHISFNLAAKGYNVAKYLPFGPVRDVMPYLIRRAEENTSVAGQTTRELGLLKKEKKRRKI